MRQHLQTLPTGVLLCNISIIQFVVCALYAELSHRGVSHVCRQFADSKALTAEKRDTIFSQIVSDTTLVCTHMPSRFLAGN
jgi:hypothetical protein